MRERLRETVTINPDWLPMYKQILAAAQVELPQEDEGENDE